jgi:hypothetical protein
MPTKYIENLFNKVIDKNILNIEKERTMNIQEDCRSPNSQD